jgi:glycosyltransferase involved in cell wall biosynthesis
MSRVLLVTEATRSIGEFRRPWVRRLHAGYVRRYRQAVARAAARLAPGNELTVLTARQLVDAAALPTGVAVRYYDDESFRVDSRALADRTRRLTSGWWPTPAEEPALSYRGVWLPDLLTVAKALVLRLEVVERLGVLEQILEETKPEKLWLLGGASVPERLARLLAQGRDLAIRVAWRSPWPRLFAAAQAALFPREERIRLRALVDQRRRAPLALPAGGRRLLFITCRSRHHFVVDPLVAAVRAEGGEACVLASSDEDPELAARVRALAGAGVPVAYAMDYLPRGEALAILRRYRPIFRRAWRRVARDPELAARLDWHGVSLLPVLRPFLRASAEQSLLTGLLHQEAAFRAFDAVQPEAVVITSDRRYAERAAARVARARGVPSVLFSGTLVLPRDRTNAFDIGDRVLVIGEHLRRALMEEEGIPARRITVIGDPRSNAARLVSHPKLRADVYRDFDLAPGRPLLVLVSKYVSLLFSSQEKEGLYRTVFEGVRRLGDSHVVVKVHPNEDLGRLREQVAEWGWAGAILTKDYDIHRLFRAAAAAIMVTSMAGIEAMALGCPVVAVQTAGKDFEGEYMPPYVSANAVARVDMGDPAALATTLRTLQDDPAARAALVERGWQFAARYVHPVDGALAQRLWRTVGEIRAEIEARPR